MQQTRQTSLGHHDARLSELHRAAAGLYDEHSGGGRPSSHSKWHSQLRPRIRERQCSHEYAADDPRAVHAGLHRSEEGPRPTNIIAHIA